MALPARLAREHRKGLGALALRAADAQDWAFLAALVDEATRHPREQTPASLALVRRAPRVRLQGCDSRGSPCSPAPRSPCNVEEKLAKRGLDVLARSRIRHGYH